MTHRTGHRLRIATYDGETNQYIADQYIDIGNIHIISPKLQYQIDLYLWVTGHFENPAISRDSNIEDQCPPPCKSFTFSIEQTTVCLDS